MVLDSQLGLDDVMALISFKLRSIAINKQKMYSRIIPTRFPFSINSRKHHQRADKDGEVCKWERQPHPVDFG